MPTLCILGRQPAIGLAELESLYGASAVTPLGTVAALVDGSVDFARLGGSMKSAELITVLDTTNPQKAFDYCRRALPDYVSSFPTGKIKLGVSLYNLSMPLAKINANALSLKKALTSSGHSTRVVPNTDTALSTAQTYHNSLATSVGCELVFIGAGTQTFVGRVIHVQNIDSYRIRDRDRPKRDAFVGMLPPKLAQTIVNLAVGDISATAYHASPTILDPFCGTGVILQEAILMGYPTYGTDISPKMIDFSQRNLDWLTAVIDITHPVFDLAVGDATSYTWDLPTTPVFVACEGYLGQPLGGQHPTAEKLHEIIHDCNTIMRGFLKNIHTQLPSGSRLCVAAPAWHIDSATHHLPVLDDLEDLRYNRIDFEYAARGDLVYRRDDQIVGRELLVLIKQ